MPSQPLQAAPSLSLQCPLGGVGISEMLSPHSAFFSELTLWVSIQKSFLSALKGLNLCSSSQEGQGRRPSSEQLNSLQL